MSSYFQMPGIKKPKAKKATAASQVLPAQQVPGAAPQAAPQPLAAPPQPLPAGAMQDESKTLTAPQQNLAWQIANRLPPGEKAIEETPFGEPPGEPLGEPPGDSPFVPDAANEQRFQDVMKGWEESGENIEQMALGQESAAGRRAAEMNAALGRGMGGGFAGGMAQASLTGQQARLGMEQEQQKRGLEIQMTHLQDLWKQAEASKDRELQRELQDKISETMYNLKSLEYEGEHMGRAQSGDSMEDPAPESQLPHSTEGPGFVSGTSGGYVYIQSNVTGKTYIATPEQARAKGYNV